MIENERQYKITRSQAARFEHTLQQWKEQADQPHADVHLLLMQAEEEAMRSQLASLQDELAEYESLRSGTRRTFTTNSFEELPRALIQARIARGLTQRQLAEQLGLTEQQIQQYEATGYASVSLRRVNAVISALRLQVREEVVLTGTR